MPNRLGCFAERDGGSRGGGGGRRDGRAAALSWQERGLVRQPVVIVGVEAAAAGTAAEVGEVVVVVEGVGLALNPQLAPPREETGGGGGVIDMVASRAEATVHVDVASDGVLQARFDGRRGVAAAMICCGECGIYNGGCGILGIIETKGLFGYHVTS